MTHRPVSARASGAKRRLHWLKECEPSLRQQAYDSWLQIATAGEVRQNWRPWMGAFPRWAEA